MKQRIYRIHTEWSEKYQRNAEEIMSGNFDAFNITRGTGYWRGKPEESMTIELIGDVEDEADMRSMAYQIRMANGQEAVYFTVTKTSAELI